MVQAMMLKCIEVMKTKGAEYTEGSDNKLANFEAESLETDVPVLNIIHIFANKHQRAINNFRKTGQVESEALEMRFVDRINYLFLELAECIALGYEPREEWLIEALGSQGQDDTPGDDVHTVTEVTEPAGIALVEDEEPCCGHPGNDQCCEAAPSAPPAVEGEQREKRQRRRPPRPRIPQNDDNIPIATPDRRLNPEVIAERARAKKQRDE
jgi:hypothetical protein